MAGINGTAVGIAAVGVVLAYSGLKGKTITNTLRYALAGSNPADAPGYTTSYTGPDPTGVGTPGFAQTGGSQQAVIDAEFKSWGFTRAGRAGAEANIQHESGFATNNPGDGGTSNGICQWHNERWTAMVAYAHLRGLSEFDIKAQLGYLKTELLAGYPDLYGMCRLSNDPGAVAAYWCSRFERPADVEGQSAARAASARELYGTLT